MKVVIPVESVLRAAEQIRRDAIEHRRPPSHYGFDDAEEVDDGVRKYPGYAALLKLPALYYSTKSGQKIRVAGVLCSQCGHDNAIGEGE